MGVRRFFGYPHRFMSPIMNTQVIMLILQKKKEVIMLIPKCTIESLLNYYWDKIRKPNKIHLLLD